MRYIHAYARMRTCTHTHVPTIPYPLHFLGSLFTIRKLISKDVYDHSADVYAVGVIILEMAIERSYCNTIFKRIGNRFEKVNGVKVMLENVAMLCLQEKGKRVPALLSGHPP